MRLRQILDNYDRDRRNQAVLNMDWSELDQPRKVHRQTADGREKRCPTCCQWLPHDAEFFRWLPTRGHYLSTCRFCEAGDARKRRQRAKITAQPGTTGRASAH